jgi:hypothetical protein
MTDKTTIQQAMNSQLAVLALVFGVASAAINYGRNVETVAGLAVWLVVSVVGSYVVLFALSELSHWVGFRTVE